MGNCACDQQGRDQSDCLTAHFSFDSVVRLNHQKPSSTSKDYPFIWINLLFYYNALMACINDRWSFDV